ncbi:hypothetical protein [Mycolicibacterium mageritense]|uniref:hypothetical protein n=1 Tax=Mycolicibacterium mageritense TaxID=53462 RepID=UPI0013D1D3A5|nr:hypothetical protein [Mycolicibacterium mageritense]
MSVFGSSGTDTSRRVIGAGGIGAHRANISAHSGSLGGRCLHHGAGALDAGT